MENISVNIKTLEKILILLKDVNIGDDLQKEIDDIRGKIALYKVLYEWSESDWAKQDWRVNLFIKRIQRKLLTNKRMIRDGI